MSSMASLMLPFLYCTVPHLVSVNTDVVGLMSSLRDTRWNLYSLTRTHVHYLQCITLLDLHVQRPGVDNIGLITYK